MIAKLGVVEEEADESAFWLEMIPEAKLIPAAQTEALRQEASELTAIMVASRKTLLTRNPKSKFENRKSV